MSQSQPLALRGFMLDPARLTERHDFYYDILPRLAEWGYNTIWLHFCDDEGCFIELPSHPELASPYAFSPDEIRRWVAAAGEHGIDVVPEVETLGHSLWITRHPQYEHLFNGMPYGHNAVCPSHPDTLPLMTEILRDVAEMFPSPYLHAGLDEAIFRDCPRCIAASEGKEPWWPLARHTQAIHEVVKACGKRMIMWGDPVEKNPALLDELSKEIILAHWHYEEVPVDLILPSAEAGFNTICVSGVNWQLSQPDDRCLRNVNDHVELAAKLAAKGCLGSVASWWESSRSLRDCHSLSTAFAGKAMLAGKALDPEPFFHDFLSTEYGIPEPEVAEALWTVYQFAPGSGEMRFLLPTSMADLPETLKVVTDDAFAERASGLDAAVTTLVAAKASREASAFGANVLAARILAGASHTGTRLHQAYKHYQQAAKGREITRPKANILDDLNKALELLVDAQSEIHQLADDVSREWDRTRFPDDPKKNGTSPLVRQRRTSVLLVRLLRCDAFLQNTVEGLTTAITRYQQEDVFPLGV